MNRILFKLLRAELQDISPESLLSPEETELLKDSENLELLYRLSAAQDLAHMVGASLFRMKIPRDTDAAKKFRFSCISAVQRYENISRELESLRGFFEEIGVNYIPLKGTVLRQFYPRPEQRTSCDIDLLVSPQDLDRTTAALEEKLNYRKMRAGGHDVGLTAPSGVNLELHFTLIEKNDYPEMAKILETVWDHAHPDPEYPHLYRMPMAWEYFYHIAHMVKHYLYGGCGIRTFMDLWVYRRRCPGFDRDEAEKLLEKAGLGLFEENAALLSEVWFSGREADPERMELLEQMEQYIFGGGIYGNTENRVMISRSEKKNLPYICSRLILPYSRMKYEYPVLQKHPILLPVCHVRRWSRLLSGNTSKRICSELKLSSSVTDERRTEVRQMLDALGLK